MVSKKLPQFWKTKLSYGTLSEKVPIPKNIPRI